MLAKVSNDFSTPIRKDSCRSSSCVNACLCCGSANIHSVLSCKQSLTRPTIAPHSCAWQKPSPPSLLACAALRKRLVSWNVRESCGCWLKTFLSARIPLPFVTAFRFLPVRPKTEAQRPQTVKITFCVRGVVSPMLSNLYLNEVDRMLEKAIQTTRRESYTHVQYARFADDMVILIVSHPRHGWLVRAVEQRLREELAKLQVEINEEKSKIVDLANGGSFTFLGFEYRRILGRNRKWRPYYAPKLKKRTALLAKLKEIFRQNISQPVEGVVEQINPILRGWVNYFAVGDSSECFSFVRDWVEKKIRGQLMRARERSGLGWKRWSRQGLYGKLGLYTDYSVRRPWSSPKVRPAASVT